MKIILDLNGWKKEIILDDETASRALDYGYVTIYLQKPLAILVKDKDFPVNSIIDGVSLKFYDCGIQLNNKPIYKYTL